jgi:Flp pilus assembly pilin Flp
MIVFNFWSTMATTVQAAPSRRVQQWSWGGDRNSPGRVGARTLEDYCMGMLRTFVRRLVRDESGAALAEYAAIFLVLAVAGTVVLITVGGEIAAAGTAIDTWLAANVTAAF